MQNPGYAQNLFRRVLEAESEPFRQARLAETEALLRQLPLPDNSARDYFERHLPRLAQTLLLIPPPQTTSRILELGCYMQITPFLNRFSGYREVRGAYNGPSGQTDRKTIAFPDSTFECDVDHFNAERDPFPYPDEHFDTVLAGEIIEHLLFDPMHLLVESRRVLIDGGYLVVSTPNVGSITSVAKTLDGRSNPQIHSTYQRGTPEHPPEIGHMREYTMHELGEIVKAAGFEVASLFTAYLPEYELHRHLLTFLQMNGYSTEGRGEQSYCVARKCSSLPVDRYPRFLYD